jgi:hypothetical protein
MSKIEQSKTLREWILENLDEDDLKTLVKHGCEAGITGLIYHNETSDLYDAYQDEIWILLAEQTDACGYDTVLAFIASFNCAQQVEDQETFKSLLARYAVEELAYAILEERQEAAAS